VRALHCLRFEVLTAVKMLFWVVTPCGLVGRYQCFGNGDSMFLWNVGVCLRIHTASQSVTVTSIALQAMNWTDALFLLLMGLCLFPFSFALFFFILLTRREEIKQCRWNLVDKKEEWCLWVKSVLSYCFIYLPTCLAVDRTEELFVVSETVFFFL
jgi:hypothetical protein